MIQSTPSHVWRVAALYRFFPVADPGALREELLPFCRQSGIKGTLIIAEEGINGTVAGSDKTIDALLAKLEQLAGFTGAEVKFSTAAEMPFRRMKIRIKHEIVTMGLDGIDPDANRGAYVEPQKWNALISAPDTVLIDTRNRYETAIGTFEGAIDPEIDTFREFPDWVEENRPLLEGKKIAMFCTGGIRCEKATAYVNSLGLGEVFHLKGGILKYLEDTPKNDSQWLGDCFVFDERVAVSHGLSESDYELCRACRYPLAPEERSSEDYIEGISCPHCRNDRTEDDRARYAQRQRQIELAGERGEEHPIGRSQVDQPKKRCS